MLTFRQQIPLFSFLGGTFPTLTIVGLIALIKFPSWNAAFFVLVHILLSIYSSGALTFEFLLNQCLLLQHDLGSLEKDYTLEVVSPAARLKGEPFGERRF